MNVARVFAQIDTYEWATILIVIAALIVLPAIGRWLSEHDEEQVGQTVAFVLTGLTAFGTVVAIAAAVFGAHPA